LTRTVLFCALSLVTGIGVGQYFLRQQLQLQQGVVGQLQHEIRGLTSDIQRMELASSRSIARFENTLSRLEAAQRFELAGESRLTQERLGTLVRLVERQVEATLAAQAACLAEFGPYRGKSLAVPVDVIAAAVERFTAGRTADLQVLAAELHSHAETERERLATLENQWNLSDAGSARVLPRQRTSLAGGLPGFPYAGSLPVTPDVAVPRPVDGAATAVLPAVASPSLAAVAPGIPATIAAPQRVVTQVSTPLMPIPDGPPPAPRSVVDVPRMRKPRPALLSFASGRRVPGSSPAAAPVATLPDAGAAVH
jgi:hypothetical protein